ncbi:hypothetical protein BpHYR1_015724 [Brachionus plicatilis]|uniref:Uncharacterized protein n=1 Tax=Brachionus plicatilis TaxID=10195 RepID=A0A3M7RPA6_BRAPC|nr:hypothetical protein BpHYR1_015724 [Brachionus plicatilis]
MLQSYKKKCTTFLKSHELDEIDEEKILFLIFGSDKERDESLIASSNRIQYIERLELLSNYFDSIKHKSNASSFADWFLDYKAKKIYDFFVEPNRKFTDKLNNYYTTNNVESFNKSIKVQIHKMKNNLTEIFNFLEELSNGQINKSKYVWCLDKDNTKSHHLIQSVSFYCD